MKGGYERRNENIEEKQRLEKSWICQKVARPWGGNGFILLSIKLMAQCKGIRQDSWQKGTYKLIMLIIKTLLSL